MHICGWVRLRYFALRTTAIRYRYLVQSCWCPYTILPRWLFFVLNSPRHFGQLTAIVQVPWLVIHKWHYLSNSCYCLCISCISVERNMTLHIKYTHTFAMSSSRLVELWRRCCRACWGPCFSGWWKKSGKASCWHSPWSKSWRLPRAEDWHCHSTWQWSRPCRHTTIRQCYGFSFCVK